MKVNLEPWECACGEITTVTHWRHGADGAMFHAGPDASPSDEAPMVNEESSMVNELDGGG